jgi:hypothetical protein
VNAAVRNRAASCSESAALTSAQTSSGEKTSMSLFAANGGFSTSATGFAGSAQTLRARWKMPCMRTSALTRVLEARSTPASHVSIVAVVIDSIGIDPNVGSSWARTIAW